MTVITSLTPRRLSLAIIVAPITFALIYFIAFAADRFVSDSVITVRQANQTSASAVSGLAAMLAGVSSTSREDTLLLREYVHSLDMLKKLDAKLQLRRHFEEPTLDPFYRIYGQASQERFLEYYRSRVDASYDDLTGLLTLRTQGFDPDFAQRLNKAVMAESEAFVNEVSQKMGREQMAFAESELKRAHAAVDQAKEAVLQFQARNKILDPMAQAQATGTMAAAVKSELAKREVELRHLQTFLNDDTFQVAALKSQIAALRAQLDIELRESTSNRGESRAGSERLNSLAAQFRGLTQQVGFAEEAYKLALAATETTRLEALRKTKSLVIVQSPSKPETALYPRKGYVLLTMLLVCSLIYAIVRLIVATIREHQD
jgi:capsular polysaccharide transport system permease protein